MVKGTSKRVVVVKSPDPKIFEQAIFIVREDFLGHGRTNALKEAQQVADAYIKSAVSVSGRRRKLPGWLMIALIAAASLALGFGIRMLWF